MNDPGGNAHWNRLKYILIAALLPLVASCGSSGGGASYVSSDTTVAVPATNASVSLDFDFSVTGTGGGLIGNIDISASQGTIVINNQTVNTIVYASIPWESSGYNLYQGIAFLDADFFVYWLYCRVGSNSLDKLYYESTNQYRLTRESASGTCNPKNSASQPSFSRAGGNIGIDRLVSGYTLTGSDISLDSGQSGTLTYNGTPFVFYPFQEVDCSGCSGGPWRELHSIAYDAAGQKTCFTILYLYDGSDSVFSSYSICFSDLGDINATLSGTWAIPNI